MLIEVVAFWGFLCLILMGFAELHIGFRMLGVIGCVLLIPLAFWVWTDNVSIQTGEVKVYTGIDTTTGFNPFQSFANQTQPNPAEDHNLTTTTIGNTTINQTTLYAHNETTTKTTAVISLPYFAFNQVLALLLFAMSIFGMVHYAISLRTGDTIN